MGVISDGIQSIGDVIREIRDIKKRLRRLETARRLEAASIGEGGLRVKGGHIIILDADGNETMRLATDGLTLEGLLRVIGSIEIAGGEVRSDDYEEGVSGYRLAGDGSAEFNSVVVRGRVEADAGSISGNLDVTGSLTVEGGGNIIIGDGGDLEIHDSAGNVRFATVGGGERFHYTDEVGNVLFAIGLLVGAGGAPVGHGILVQDAAGDDLLSVRDGKTHIGATSDADTIMTRPGDNTDVLVRLTATDGFRVADPIFVTGGIAWGPASVGSTDSGGAGFRVVRVPNAAA